MAFSPQALLSRLHRLPATEAYLVACSGGLDSVVLLHALATLRNQQHIASSLRVIHIDHGLNPDSACWAQWVESLCLSLDIGCETVRVNAYPARGESPEAAARLARYEAISTRLGNDEILLTGQHADDQAETLLLRLMRGSGVRGLSAMAEIRPFGAGYLARPLLDFTRAQLCEYAVAQGLEWLEDPSNDSLEYDRNRLRHRLIPALRERWPAVARTLSRSAAHCAEAASLLDQLAVIDLQDQVASAPLPVALLVPLDRARARNLLRYWIDVQKAQQPTQAQLNSLLEQALSAREDANLRIAWGSYQVRRYAGRLYLLTDQLRPPGSFSLAWDLMHPLELPSGLGKLVVEPARGAGLDAELLQGGVRVSLREGGEWMRPLGAPHTRTLKRLLHHAGVPPWERERIPLIWSGDHLLQVGNRWLAADAVCAANRTGVKIRWLETGDSCSTS